jgi:hypothetical protein
MYKFNLTVAAVLIVFAFLSCSTQKNDRIENAPILTSATYQHTLYNGKPQPVDAKAAKEGVPKFIITYFTNLEDLEKNKNGSKDAPSAVGKYYVKIERPGGNGFAKGYDVTVEYFIQKAFINIIADEKQETVYDGNLKSVAATANEPVALEVYYYRSKQGREKKDLNNIVKSPVEKGIYYVSILFAGNENYLHAQKDVELIIK